MLVLARKTSQELILDLMPLLTKLGHTADDLIAAGIDRNITIMPVEIRHSPGDVRLGITADRLVRIVRREVVEAERMEAAQLLRDAKARLAGQQPMARIAQ